MTMLLKWEDIRAGDRLVAYGNFTCICEGAVLPVHEDNTGLFVSCSYGRHYLDGQLDNTGENVVGFGKLDEEAFIRLYNSCGIMGVAKLEKGFNSFRWVNDSPINLTITALQLVIPAMEWQSSVVLMAHPKTVAPNSYLSIDMTNLI